MASHIGRPVFATIATVARVWSATPALARVLGRSAPTSFHWKSVQARLTPFGGVHISTEALPTARFPGRWFQSESGLHQNWMRDYGPTTGRYVQTDPLGLVDRASVYEYARQSPLWLVDPWGEAVLAFEFNEDYCAFGGGDFIESAE